MKIALYGTFDVDNFGDLLFPHIAHGRFPEHEWTFVSPTNSPTWFSDSKTTIDFQTAAQTDFDLIVIGGGNIIHTKPTSLAAYQKLNVHNTAYPELWLGAARTAQNLGIPYLFNAPGISHLSASKIERLIFREVFSNCKYLSFRAAYSCDFASRFTQNEIFHVPDTAFDIARIWPRKRCDKRPAIVINLNQRYHHPPEKTASSIDAISRKLLCDVEIVVIGDCHGDLEFSRRVAQEIKTARVNLVEQQSLKELAHRIAGALCFIGSSMHGFITALSYKTPALLVLNNRPMHKFLDLAEFFDLSRKIICSDWNEAINRIDMAAALSDAQHSYVAQSLDRHWERILEAPGARLRKKKSGTIEHWKLLVETDRIVREFRQRWS